MSFKSRGQTLSYLVGHLRLAAVVLAPDLGHRALLAAERLPGTRHVGLRDHHAAAHRERLVPEVEAKAASAARPEHFAGRHSRPRLDLGLRLVLLDLALPPGVQLLRLACGRRRAGGLGGELGAEMKLESEDSETGEVGSDTVMGGLGALKFRLKIKS